MREEYHDRVLAGEEEGSGFASMCDETNVPWLVFRGISDYGDVDRKQTKVLWNPMAAVSAAATAVHFLRTTYRRVTART
jgi:nucleoside phosphorylase